MNPGMILRQGIACSLLSAAASLVPCAAAAPASAPAAEPVTQRTLRFEPGDEEYVARFHTVFTKADPVPTLAEYATAERFDALYLGEYEQTTLAGLDNHEAKMAWGSAYYHMALNEMFRATGDVKYFEAAVRLTSATLSARDDHRGLTLFNGAIEPVWGCGKYDERGRIGHLVHNGMIAYPILDTLWLGQLNPACGRVLGERAQPWLEDALKSLDVFEPYWVDGPAPGEGYYVSRNEEVSAEGKAQSANRLSALGRAHWIAAKLTPEPRYRERALAIGRYLKNRIHLDTTHDAWLWAYTLKPEDKGLTAPQTELREVASYGEDISHGVLTAGLPMMLALEGEGYEWIDMQRLSNTLTRVVARPGGILLPYIGGNPKATPAVGGMLVTSRWLPLTKFEPQVYDVISEFLRTYVPEPHALDLAMLLQYAGDARDHAK